MADKTENKKVDLNSQYAAERNLYLGKLSEDDKIPGSDLTVKEAKEAFDKQSKKFEAEKFNRRQAIAKSAEPVYQTSLVVPGVNVDVKMPKTEVVMSEAAQKAVLDKNGLLPLPSDEELSKMPVDELIALAVARNVDAKANVDTKPTIIKKLNGTYKAEDKTKADDAPKDAEKTDDKAAK